MNPIAIVRKLLHEYAAVDGDGKCLVQDENRDVIIPTIIQEFEHVSIIIIDSSFRENETKKRGKKE